MANPYRRHSRTIDRNGATIDLHHWSPVSQHWLLGPSDEVSLPENPDPVGFFRVRTR